MQQALKTCPDASFLLSAGDQINQSGAAKAEDKKTREMSMQDIFIHQYSEAFQSLPQLVTTIWLVQITQHILTTLIQRISRKYSSRKRFLF